MEKKRGFLKFYLYLALIVSVLGFVDTSLALANYALLYITFIISTLTFMFFWISLLALFLFTYNRLERITYSIPIFYMTVYVVMTIVSAVLYFKGMLGTVSMTIFNSVALLVYGIIFFLAIMQIEKHKILKKKLKS
jgi:hypothetical protein